MKLISYIINKFKEKNKGKLLPSMENSTTSKG